MTTSPKARADAARAFPTHTCAASRHAQQIGEGMVNEGKWYETDAAEEEGESILSTVASLWEARARIAQQAERIALLEADRDSWYEQHSDRVDDALKFARQHDAAVAECERLRAGYAEAIDDIADWGIYASAYFQKKHDLAGTIAKHRAAIDAQSKGGA